MRKPILDEFKENKNYNEGLLHITKDQQEMMQAEFMNFASELNGVMPKKLTPHKAKPQHKNNRHF